MNKLDKAEKSTAVGEGDASPDHPSPPNCSTPLRDDKLSDDTDHSNFQYLYHHSDLPEQRQEEHQSQSDDIVTLIAEETSDHREHGGHASIETQVQTGVSDNQSEVDDATYHFEGVREQLTTSKVDNFCQDKGKEGVPSLPTHSEEVGGGDGLPCEKVDKQDIRPGDALDQVIEDRDIPLQSVPAVGGVSSKVQDCPPKNSVVSESSLTEVSSSVEAIVNEFGRFPVETDEAVKQRLIELFKEESKKLKVAKAAYLSKKQTIRELKMLFEQGLSLSESEEKFGNDSSFFAKALFLRIYCGDDVKKLEKKSSRRSDRFVNFGMDDIQILLLSVEGNSSSANSYTDVTSSKSETLADASCHSIVNSPPPSSKSSPRSHNPSRSRMSPCFKIVSTSRKPNTDFLQTKPAKPTKKSNLLDVEKMYVEFIRAFERSQPRHRAFTGKPNNRSLAILTQKKPIYSAWLKRRMGSCSFMGRYPVGDEVGVV
ncbi:hypothetical protein TSMEX_009733 [Taenia solium]|eukprot:TsM_001173600 transcript=TsM_001173600 gene=TsM_001173600